MFCSETLAEILVVYWSPAEIYLFMANNGNTKTRCEICWKSVIKLPEWRQWQCSGVFIADFKHILYIVSVFLSSSLNK